MASIKAWYSRLPAVFLLWQWPAREGWKGDCGAILFGDTVRRAFALGVPIVYGTAYYLTGTQGGRNGPSLLHVTLTQEVYTHITPLKMRPYFLALPTHFFPVYLAIATDRCLADVQYDPGYRCRIDRPRCWLC